ncbi:MAG TPA: hypothetical protein VEJ84_22505 [Acidimicrobiales bacterium]|nr:hypothetical protein [Acidimicrobiales bacterium]
MTTVRATHTETAPGPSGVGEVVLEVGGETGAAVIFTGAELEGEEIEIRAAGAPWTGTHVAVRERRLCNGSRWAALFGSLREGSYEARLKGNSGSPVIRIEVSGSRVANADWPVRHDR